MSTKTEDQIIAEFDKLFARNVQLKADADEAERLSANARQRLAYGADEMKKSVAELIKLARVNVDKPRRIQKLPDGNHVLFEHVRPEGSPSYVRVSVFGQDGLLLATY